MRATASTAAQEDCRIAVTGCPGQSRQNTALFSGLALGSLASTSFRPVTQDL